MDIKRNVRKIVIWTNADARYVCDS